MLRKVLWKVRPQYYELKAAWSTWLVLELMMRACAHSSTAVQIVAITMITPWRHLLRLTWMITIADHRCLWSSKLIRIIRANSFVVGIFGLHSFISWIGAVAWTPLGIRPHQLAREWRGIQGERIKFTRQLVKGPSTGSASSVVDLPPSLSGKCVLGVVNLKGFTATALFLCFCFSFLRARPAVAVRIKRDKSIGGWTLGPRVVLPPSLFRPIGPILECAFIGETKWTNR